jgi:hypothetical protein
MVKNKRRGKSLSNRNIQSNKTNTRTEDDDEPIRSNRFVKYAGTTRIKKSEDKEILSDDINKQNQLNNEHKQSNLAKIPLKKRLSVQFYPVEHVQFISNRLGKSEK